MLLALSLNGITPGLYTPLVVAGAICTVLLLIGKVPLGYNLRNLAVRWRTTLLTALAFTLVIGLMVVMLAFVNGMTQLTDAERSSRAMSSCSPMERPMN